MREKNLGLWEEVTWADYWDSASLVGHALLSLGIEVGDRVAIVSENRREWLFADIGITAVRAATVGLLSDQPRRRDPPRAGRLRLAHRDRRGPGAGRQGARGRDGCPTLEHIVYLEPRGIRGHYDDAG